MEARSSHTDTKTRETPRTHRLVQAHIINLLSSKNSRKIINNRLKWYLDKNALLPKHQTGFRRGCTTTDNLIRLEEAISNGFNTSHSTTAVFLDLAKAYDDTWLTGLLYKATKFNIRGVMLNWLSNFLTNRTVNVKIEDSLSNTPTMNKGVPQGCVLSPILLNIMMADFPLPDPRTNLALFADDILIYTTSPTNPEAERILQRYLNKIDYWATSWKFKFSVPKCATQTFLRKRAKEIDVKLFLNKSQINSVNHYKYLGITFDSKLNWDNHLNNTSIA